MKVPGIIVARTDAAMNALPAAELASEVTMS
jgi:hypothetical protein